MNCAQVSGMLITPALSSSTASRTADATSTLLRPSGSATSCRIRQQPPCMPPWPVTSTRPRAGAPPLGTRSPRKSPRPIAAQRCSAPSSTPKDRPPARFAAQALKSDAWSISPAPPPLHPYRLFVGSARRSKGPAFLRIMAGKMRNTTISQAIDDLART